jgi:hypothetical protein
MRGLTNPAVIKTLAAVLNALPARLTEGQANRAFIAVHKRFDRTTSSQDFLQLAEALTALAPKLTEAPTSHAFDAVLKRIGQTTDEVELDALVKVLAALAPKLTEAQSKKALDVLQDRISQTRDSEKLQGLVQVLAQALAVLGPKVTETQGGQALDLVLRHLGDSVYGFDRLEELFGALPGKLTEAQSNQVLELLMRTIRESDKSSRVEMANGLTHLAPKLSDGSRRQASTTVVSWLAWAPDGFEAAAWADALVSLTAEDTNGTPQLVEAITYPAAAGSNDLGDAATDVLLEAIRTRRPGAPTKEAGTEAALQWLAINYPRVLQPPVCPPPPRPLEISGFKCPTQEIGSGQR